MRGKNILLFITSGFLFGTLGVHAMDVWGSLENISDLKGKCLNISISDPCVKELAAKEDNRESLVDLLELANPRIIALKSLNPTADPGHSSFAKVRASLAKALNHMLEFLPENIGIAIFEGFRPLWKQKEYFDAVFKENLTLNPGLSLEEVYDKTAQSVSEFINNPFAHGTGGAIDFTLFKIMEEGHKELLDMGKMGVIFGANPQKETFSENISEIQRDNRLLLLKSAEKVGLVNYGFEWWHYSLFDAAWAYVTKQKAMYGLATEKTSVDVDIPKDKEAYLNYWSQRL